MLTSRSYSKISTNYVYIYICIYNRVSYSPLTPLMWHHRISEKISNLSQQLRHLRPVASLWKQTARLYDAQGILGTSIGCREEATKNLGIFSRVNWKIYMGIINDFRTDFRQNSKQKQKCSKMTCQKYKCKDTAAKVRVFLLPTHTIYRIEQWVVWVDGSL